MSVYTDVTVIQSFDNSVESTLHF